ncbi:MAG: helix-turn-helix transcriptional regulator [Verrucomicrobiales bacterium]|jgi:transcriptional regulator with XRE-family HTH domain|nr:helix-turn-helix transcriptional regulator [Verrucomicrobiales bacterium]
MPETSGVERFLRERLRLLRETSGLSQLAVSEMAGISYIYYQSIEAGRRPNVSLRVLDKLTMAYGITIHELFALSPPMVTLSKRPMPSPHRKRKQLPPSKNETAIT